MIHNLLTCSDTPASQIAYSEGLRVKFSAAVDLYIDIVTAMENEVGPFPPHKAYNTDITLTPGRFLTESGNHSVRYGLPARKPRPRTGPVTTSSTYNSG